MKKVLFVFAALLLMTTNMTPQSDPSEGNIPMPAPPCEVRGGTIEVVFVGFTPVIWYTPEYCVQTSYCVCQL